MQPILQPLWLIGAIAFGIFSVANSAQALPVLREAVGDWENGGVVSLFPDHEDPKLFYFLPNQMDFAQDRSSGLPLFGMATYGVETGDPRKARGYMTFTFRPMLSASVREQLGHFAAEHPHARLAPLPVGTSYLAIGHDRSGLPSEPASAFFEAWDLPPYGGLLETEVGGNAYLSGLGAIVLTEAIRNPSLIHLSGCYAVEGVTPPMEARVKVDYQRLFEYWKAVGSAEIWIFGGSIAKEVHRLVETGVLEIQVQGDTRFEEVVMELARQIAREYFKPVPSLGRERGAFEEVPFRFVQFTWASIEREERRVVQLQIRKQARITDVRCIGIPFSGLAPVADRLIRNVRYSGSPDAGSFR